MTNAEKNCTELQAVIDALVGSEHVAVNKEEVSLLKFFRSLNELGKVSMLSRMEGISEGYHFAEKTNS